MTLQPGQSLGPHEILAPIGAGGMGEVYRARDTRLDRTVAIKVLPEHASNPELKQRFEREAKAIAALNHPHICILYDVGHQDGIDYLVMEYLEGESLAERLKRGPLPLDEALKYAVQIADALDKAHRQGVVHRDLKPGNIMVTKAGAKLLDFGLARLKQPGPTPAFTADSALPTGRSGLTVQGAILGTLQYMAPEQLEGKDADARTDIFAFGGVLYEMVTGKKAFEGKSQVSLIGAILEREPAPVSTLQPASPPALDVVIRRCLAKDPDERWQSAGDLEVGLKWLRDAAPVTAEPLPKSARVSRLWFAVAAGFFLAMIALAAVVVYDRRPPVESAAVRFFVSAPDKTIFSAPGAGTPIISAAAGSISPNGRKLAFTAKDESGKFMLWVRALDTLAAQVLPGTDGAFTPFWSPDSRWLAFFAQGKLKKIDVEGGPPQTLCDAPNARGGTWNRDGVIAFAPNSTGSLSRVSSSGGQAVAVTKLGPEQTGHRFPSFLPDGRHFFYLAQGTAESSGVFIGSLDSFDGQRLLAADSPAVYALPGYVLFIREGTLLAQPFDTQKLHVTGEAVPIAEQVAFDGPALGFSASENGVLEYRTGAGALNLQLTWIDRTGKLIESIGVPGKYQGPDLSPDGKEVAVHRHEGTGGDVWLVEAAGGKTSRLTFDASQENSQPIWSPDGSRIVFGSRRNGKWGLYQKPSNGTGNEELLVESELVKMPMTWSGDGKFIVYNVEDPKTGRDVWALPLAGDRKPFPILQTPFAESHPQVSPDGKWIAYRSNETGRNEIYVQSFPPGGGKWQISSNGGEFFRWRRDGRELFYMDAASFGKIVSVGINTTGSKFETSAPHPLFDSGYINSNFGHSGNWSAFAVSPDGQRFLIPRPESNLTGATANTPITVVLNWTAALKK